MTWYDSFLQSTFFFSRMIDLCAGFDTVAAELLLRLQFYFKKVLHKLRILRHIKGQYIGPKTIFHLATENKFFPLLRYTHIYKLLIHIFCPFCPFCMYFTLLASTFLHLSLFSFFFLIFSHFLILLLIFPPLMTPTHILCVFTKSKTNGKMFWK